MSVHQDEAIGERQPGEVVGTLHQLVRSLAVRGTFLSDCLIEARRRAAATVTEEDDAGNPRLLAKEFDAALDIERVSLEIYGSFVVVGTRVPGEHQESAYRKLPRGHMREEVGGAVRQQDGDIRPRSGVGRVQGTFDRSGTELNVKRIALCERLRRSGQQNQSKRSNSASDRARKGHVRPSL